MDTSQNSEPDGAETEGGGEKEKVEEDTDSGSGCRVRVPTEVAEGSGKLSVYLHKREDQKASDIIRPLLRCVCVCVVCVCDVCV